MFLQIPELEEDMKNNKIFLKDIKDQSSFIMLKDSFNDIYEMKQDNKIKMFISSFERDSNGHLIKKMKRTDLKNMQESLKLSEEFKFDITKIEKLNSNEQTIINQIKDLNYIFKKGIYFHGVGPVNKSLILKHIVKFFLIYTSKYNNITAAYVDMQELRKYFTNNQKTNFDKLNSIAKEMMEVDMLAIDNFFQRPVSEWFFDNFYFNIIKKRFTENKITFIASDLTYEEILNTEIKVKMVNLVNFNEKMESFIEMLRTLTQSFAIDETIKKIH